MNDLVKLLRTERAALSEQADQAHSGSSRPLYSGSASAARSKFLNDRSCLHL